VGNVPSPVGRAFERIRRVLAGGFRSGRRSAVLGTVLLIGSTAAVMATANTAPTITSATMSPGIIDEGQTATLSVTFTDPDAADLHTVWVKWHDGSPKEQVVLPAGQTSFQRTHTFRNSVSGPSGSKVQVTVYDRTTPPGGNDNADGSGHDAEFAPIQVNNVAPRFVDSSIVGTASAGGVVVEGDFTEPSPVDTVQVTGAVGNPIFPPNQTPMACTLLKGERRFRCEHTQQPNLQARTYTINLLVKDDDGGQDTHAMTVRFNGITRP